MSGVTALFSIHFSRGFRRGQILAMAGVILSLVAFSTTPRFHMVRKSSVAGTMCNDARQIAFAAREYLAEYQLDSVVLVYDPATGDVSGPLNAYVRRLTKGYAPVPARLTKTATFQLGHPKVGVLTFGATGQLVEDKPSR